MELVGNTFFWTFFYMIGFVASLEIVEELGPQFIERWIHRRIPAPVLIAIYVVAVIFFIRALRLFGTTYTWTANALRNGTLIYISKRLNDRKAFRWLLLGVFISFWPFWHWDIPSLVGFILTLLILIPINNHQVWIKANHVRHGIVLVSVSLIYWLFDMFSYHYELLPTLEVTLTFVIVVALAHVYDHLLVYRRKEADSLQYDNQHDALTGAYSLSKFTTDFTRYRQLAVSGSPVEVHLVMIDIDHFKAVNDTYGHLAGNDVLKTFVADLTQYLDQIKYPSALYRTGGEEFSILLSGGANDEEARALVAHYSKHLQQLKIHTSGTTLSLTISAGITRVLAQDAQNDRTIARADAHLYEAKNAGRNRVVADT
ncbi:GGDEF domain-containing protein [Lacticaseibacillus sp. GG6-2]